MDLLNGSPYVVETTQAIDKHGKRYMVVIAKATYDFPIAHRGCPVLATQQVPILAADIFEAEPGLSNPFFECDYGLNKKRCDVILKATAYAPKGKPVKELLVGFRVGSCKKILRVVGNRTWRGMINLSPSSPEPFTQMPITYSRAFGGSIPPLDSKDSGISYDKNPIGCGYAKGKYVASLKGTKVPNMEHPERPIRNCNENYPPWSFGPIGRSWHPRIKLAGTYDDHWKENVFPLLPTDFDDGFMQIAPQDQQIPFPVGGEAVVLMNLHPEKEHIEFSLPDLSLPMVAITQNHTQRRLEPVVDCITLDADSGQLTLLWRANIPIKRSLTEIHTLGIGKVSHCKWQAIVTGRGTCCGDEIKETNDDLIDVTDAMENCNDCGMTT